VTVTLAAGEEKRVAITFEVAVAEASSRGDPLATEERSQSDLAPSAPSGSPGRAKRLLGLVTAGVGLALVGAGLYFGAVAAGEAEELDKCARAGGTCTPSLSARRDAGESADTKAKLLLGLGGAAVVTGAILYYLGHREGRRAAAPSALLLPGGGGLAFEGTF
jgi:hypothetical protein